MTCDSEIICLPAEVQQTRHLVATMCTDAVLLTLAGRDRHIRTVCGLSLQLLETQPGMSYFTYFLFFKHILECCISFGLNIVNHLCA